MNKNKNGFIIIENVISMSIMVLISSLVVSIFSTSIFCVNKFKIKQQMINIAKSEMNKFRSYEKHENTYKEIDGYKVDQKVTSLMDYYNCYKFSILVESENDKVQLESYMVKN